MNMLTSLKQTGKTIGSEINQAWGSLAEGWRELLSRGSASLTQFKPDKGDKPARDSQMDRFPRWSLLAGELEETAGNVVVRVELPGMEKADCEIILERNMLHVRGEKRFQRETSDSTYHMMERAYGFFQRSIPLPRNVAIDKAEAAFKNGVLTVRLPKGEPDRSKLIPIS
ncbi:MAG: Hsp20/alpha crystallin family protein [Rhodoferax sp.]